MKVIFLHGIGAGDGERDWLAGLNRGLEQAGYGPVREDQVIAPRYTSLLKTDGIAAKLPPKTYRVSDDRASRRDFERRQARVQRILKFTHTVRGFGFDRVPPAVVEALAPFLIGSTDLRDLARPLEIDEVEFDECIDDFGDVEGVSHWRRPTA